MASKKDVFQVWRSYGTGTGGYRRLEPLNEAELAARTAMQQQAHREMIDRQIAEEKRFLVKPLPPQLSNEGCVFAKSCNLPDAIIDYHDPTGYVPLDKLRDYAEYALLGGVEADSTGRLRLRMIGGSSLPTGFGGLSLGGVAKAGGLSTVATASASTMAAAFLAGIVALVWPSNLGDSALYSEDQLRVMTKARTRVRLNIEQRDDGTLKAYAFYTGKNHDWEMVNVVQFQIRRSQYVADLGDGVELIWTPATDPASTLGIPALEAAPPTPHIWVYPPTEQAADIIVDPIYPPEYRDFILVFPVDSGISPLYVVLNWKYEDAPYHGKNGNSVKSKRPENGQDSLNESIEVNPPNSRRRIAIDPHTKEFVVIDRTAEDTYHAHVRTWNDLRQDMKNALIRAGKTNRKGKILGDTK
ncbi:S-type Pyocin [Pseudomonas fluorescens ABAC62]|nr:S-type Pyocin [Pseudomonas fluorescens ABAC62]